jgi:anti-sigma B factor antagonist
MMHVDIEELNNFCVVELKGGVTLSYAIELKDVLLESIANHPDIEVRLNDINEIDTAGVQMLWLAKREARQSNKTLRYVDHSPVVAELLQIYNLIEVFADPLPDHTYEAG